MPRGKKDTETTKSELPAAEMVADSASLFAPELIQAAPVDRAGAAPEPVAPAVKPAAASMFSLENLAMAAEMIAVPPAQDGPIEIARPNKDRFIRACPLPGYSVIFPVISYEGEFCPILPALAAQLKANDQALGPLVAQARFTLCATLEGPFFVWATRIQDGKPTSTSLGQEMALEAARLKWVRVQWNDRARAHETVPLLVERPEPVWPERAFPEILEQACGPHRMIMSADHDILMKLSGRKV